MFDFLKTGLKNIFKKVDAKVTETEPKKIDSQIIEKGSKSVSSPLIPEKKLSNDILARKIKEGPLDDVLWKLEIVLLEADVAFAIVDEIKEKVKQSLLGKKFSYGQSLEEIVEISVKEAVIDILKINKFDFDTWIKEQKRPTPIIFVGINGTGKTTAIAKIAKRLMDCDNTVVLAACDTFRAGAIEQLSIHADKLKCKIIKHSQNADPAAVAFDALEHAKAKKRDIVLIDTAGRMQTDSNLIDEMKKIVRVVKPALKIFVGDALAGNDVVEQAKVFDEAIGIDAIILTKIDADSKGGAAISIAHTIGKPIVFVCNGQEYGDIVKFNTEWMFNNLFGD